MRWRRRLCLRARTSAARILVTLPACEASRDEQLGRAEQKIPACLTSCASVDTEAKTTELDHPIAPLFEQVLEQLDVALDPVHIGIDLQRAARILECAVVIFELNVDQGVAGECAEVVWV